MNKLIETLEKHPTMSALEVARVEVAKVAEPTLRAGLDAVVDLIELAECGSISQPWAIMPTAVEEPPPPPPPPAPKSKAPPKP